jgi:serine/threonine protein kinase
MPCVLEGQVPVDSLEGRNLGRYRVLEPLGRGGMARVYRAYHPQLDRYVAIKVLRSDLVEEEEFLARFKREARAVAALRHPNVVQVFDFDVQDDVYYMVMELLDGDTLQARLHDYRARGEHMPWGEMVHVLLDVLDGLAYAHAEGMIHRDVKPANILLTRRGQAILTDFGIAQIVGGTRYTVSGALMGTLSYMSPEQGMEGQCDARSDIYSLGIVLYEILTGEPPFDADTPLAILMKHVNDPLPLPCQSDPSIPAPFERVVLKALAKRPGDRYQDAGEMAAALRQAAQEAGIQVPLHISAPLSFATADAPSESVAVLSGSARARMRDVEFAQEDTDSTLARRLAAERAASGMAQQAASSRAERRAARRETKHRARQSAYPVPPVPPVSPALIRQSEDRRTKGHRIMNAVGWLVIANLVAVLLGLVTGRWGILSRGWPFELLLVGFLLSAVMDTSGSPWLLIPTIIVLGNGFLFSFYATTGAWILWAFLWPLEPLLIVGTVFYTIRLADQGERACQVCRRLAYLLRRPTLVMVVLVALVGMWVGS